MNREEQALVGVVVAVSAAMVIGSFQYGQEVQYLPQIAGTATVVLGVFVVLNDRFDLLAKTDANLVDQVQDNPEIKDQLHGTDGDDGDSTPKVGMADPGEFRIDQPLMEYRVPFTDATVTHRATVSVLIVLYAGLAWLFGVFISSLLFLAMYGKVVGLRPRVFVALFAFTVGALVFFGMWLETPLFRPGHQLFEIPEVGL